MPNMFNILSAKCRFRRVALSGCYTYGLNGSRVCKLMAGTCFLRTCELLIGFKMYLIEAVLKMDYLWTKYLGDEN